jgi:hypothetical protein
MSGPCGECNARCWRNVGELAMSRLCRCAPRCRGTSARSPAAVTMSRVEAKSSFPVLAQTAGMTV